MGKRAIKAKVILYFSKFQESVTILFLLCLHFVSILFRYCYLTHVTHEWLVLN